MSVDRQDGDIYFPAFEGLHQVRIWNCITTVIDDPVSNLNDQTYILMVTVLILFKGFMRGWDRLKGEVRNCDRLRMHTDGSESLWQDL